jgi:hypothetical protein
VVRALVALDAGDMGGARKLLAEALASPAPGR